MPGVILAWAIWRLLPEPARGGQSRLQAGDELIRSATQVAREQPAPARGGDAAASTSPRGEDEGKVAREVQKQAIAPHEDLVLDTDPAGKSLWWAVRYVLSVRTKRVLILASALGYFFFSGLRTFAVVFLRDRFGIAQGVASILLVVIGVGAIVGVLATGRLGDWLIERRHITARPLVGGLSFLLAAALFLPGLLTTSLLVAAPLFFFAAAGVGGANPPLDAARLDIMHSRLWGWAEAVRTVLCASLEAIAPLLFGYVSTQFGAHTSGLGNPTGDAGPGGSGLDDTFLIMLMPLTAAGLLLLLRARSTYPRDVATALASEHATHQQPPAGLRYRARPGHRETNPAMIMRNEPHPAGELPPSPPAAAAFLRRAGRRKEMKETLSR